MSTERRRQPRARLALPVRVQGRSAGGDAWEEISTTVDVSAGGACFPLATRAVELGELLQLTLPMPKRLRHFDVNDGTYRIFALVRGMYRKDQRVRVCVMFYGKYPPRGYIEQPTMRFLLPGDGVEAPVPDGMREEVPGAGAPAGATSRQAYFVAAHRSAGGTGAERRSAPRVDIFVNFVLRVMDADGNVHEELTVADNLAAGGARVMTTLRLRPGDAVQLREAGSGEFATRAEVRAISQAQAGVERLHLCFLDGQQAPDRLLRQ